MTDNGMAYGTVPMALALGVASGLECSMPYLAHELALLVEDVTSVRYFPKIFHPGVSYRTVLLNVRHSHVIAIPHLTIDYGSDGQRLSSSRQQWDRNELGGIALSAALKKDSCACATRVQKHAWPTVGHTNHT